MLASSLAARRSEALRDWIYLAELATVFALAVWGFIGAQRGDARTLFVPGLCAACTR